MALDITHHPETTIQELRDYHGQPMTREAFLALPETTQPIELVEGVVYMAPSPNYDHQKISVHLSTRLLTILPNGDVGVAPLDVHFDDETILQPDLFWVSQGNPNCILQDGYWHGAPDLCIEILSPSTAIRDKRDKFALYERFGVREYWIVDPTHQVVDVWSLVEGKFTRIGTFGAADTLPSVVLSGVSVSLASIFPIG